MGKVIVFSNQKGGVGKTSTCVNMSYCIAQQGKKVIMIDMDPQGNATTGLGFNKGAMKNSVYNVIVDDMPIKEAVIETDFENLSILPSSIELAGAEVELVYIKNREKRLFDALKSIKKEYDYITIDCPPSLALLTINALTAGDGLIIPIQCEYFALEGLSQLINSIKLVKKHLNSRLEILGVCLTMYDGRALISRQIAEEIRGFFGEKVFKTVIPRNIRVSEAPSHGVPVMLHDPKCAGAKAYYNLTNEFLEKGDK